MSGRTPPFGPQAPSGQQVIDRREVAVALDELQQSMRASGHGLPRQGLIVSDARAQWGELLYCDPTVATADGNGVCINIYLPKATRREVTTRGSVSVKNYSDSTNKIRVWAAAENTIDKAPYKDMAVAGELATFLVIEEGKVICARSDGCL